MEQTNTTQKPEGKGMGTAGFVISLVALALLLFIVPSALFAAALGSGTGLSIFWVILSLLGAGLSIMGMMKLGKTGGKKGLATTGMVLGIVSFLISAWLVYAVSQVHATVGDKVLDGIEQASKSLGNIDSLTKAAEKALDTTNMH